MIIFLPPSSFDVITLEVVKSSIKENCVIFRGLLLLLLEVVFFKPEDELGGPADPYLLSSEFLLKKDRGGGAFGEDPDELGTFKFLRL